jgi:hypothetical protein
MLLPPISSEAIDVISGLIYTTFDMFVVYKLFDGRRRTIEG